MLLCMERAVCRVLGAIAGGGIVVMVFIGCEDLSRPSVIPAYRPGVVLLFGFYRFEGDVPPRSLMVWRRRGSVIATEVHPEYQCYILAVPSANAARWRPDLAFFETKRKRLKYRLPAKKYAAAFSDRRRGAVIYAGNFAYSRLTGTRDFRDFRIEMFPPDWDRVRRILQQRGQTAYLKRRQGRR